MTQLGKFDHLLSDTPRVSEHGSQGGKHTDSPNQRDPNKRKSHISEASHKGEGKIFSKFDSPSFDSFDRIESNKSQLQSILNGRRSYNGQISKELSGIGARSQASNKVDLAIPSSKSGLRTKVADSQKGASPAARLRLAQSCANIKSNSGEDTKIAKDSQIHSTSQLNPIPVNSRTGSPKQGPGVRGSEVRKDRASVPSIKADSNPSPLRLASNIGRSQIMGGIAISPTLVSGLAANSKSTVMTLSPSRKPISASGSNRSSNLASLSGLGLRKSSASRVSYSGAKEQKLVNKRQKSVDCTSPVKPRRFTHTYYMTGLKHHFKTEAPDAFTPIFKDHFQLSFNSVRFSRMLDPKEVDDFINASKIDLPVAAKNKGKPTVVFDLDETLVHCEAAKTTGGETLSVVLPNGRTIQVKSD